MPKITLTQFRGMYRLSAASHSCAQVSIFSEGFLIKSRSFQKLLEESLSNLEVYY